MLRAEMFQIGWRLVGLIKTDRGKNFSQKQAGIAGISSTVHYARDVLKATVVIFLSTVLGVSAVMAIRSESKSLPVKAFIAGLAFVVLAIVLKPEKR